MKGLIIAAIVVVVAVAIFAFGLVDVEQTRDTKMPSVAIEGGQAPKFDVDTAKVDVGTETTNIDVPTVDVGTKKEAIEVPTVEVEKAN